ncbi:hypothetical protein SAMN05443999_101220 [Roseovarius azorensis]|uniref:Uncharacterized protein n=1 Tax=Roseovarius azorensis TaxID=1287727 RepID=A0A1H7G3U7_9RHOB|nr:hypothetical protein [Roseovarius azorensis]SEK32781.1 hypothetical protein SAMN05443999_101220 [Roseovarius azorensis]
MADEDEDLPDYDDGRNTGEWNSRYQGRAWFQIIVEFLLLILYLMTASYFLIEAVIEKPEENTREGFIYSSLFGVHVAEDKAKWVALALAGFVGGTVFDLKWMYHSVAKGIWNVDRCLWRIIVPLNSAMVSLFTGFLLTSGVIPFLRNESFDDYYVLLGFGFVFGYFSDNILAALQNLAKNVFGTLDKS